MRRNFRILLPIQVKVSRSDNWPSDARDWMQISLDRDTKAQKNLGACKSCVSICIRLGWTNSNGSAPKILLHTIVATESLICNNTRIIGNLSRIGWRQQALANRSNQRKNKPKLTNKYHNKSLYGTRCRLRYAWPLARR